MASMQTKVISLKNVADQTSTSFTGNGEFSVFVGKVLCSYNTLTEYTIIQVVHVVLYDHYTYQYDVATRCIRMFLKHSLFSKIS